MRLNNMNMADIMAFIDDDCYELEEKAEKIFDYITNLEAKLAEKERQLKVVRELKNRHFNYYKTCETECNQLKQQLAEYSNLNNVLNKGLSEKCISCEEEHNQDKISFAVEKLEKVKEIISQRYRFDVEESDFAVVYEDDIEEIFNQQIKLLKEGK